MSDETKAAEETALHPWIENPFFRFLFAHLRRTKPNLVKGFMSLKTEGDNVVYRLEITVPRGEGT
jgi:hypothetical protein